jgi:hypothetical protein
MTTSATAGWASNRLQFPAINWWAIFTPSLTGTKRMQNLGNDKVGNKGLKPEKRKDALCALRKQMQAHQALKGPGHLPEKQEAR